jgi:hypothetical protein
MSFALKYATIGQQATAQIEEDSCFNLQTAAVFQAKVYERDDIPLIEDTGTDPRASHYLQIRREFNINIQAGDIIKVTNQTGTFQLEILPSIAPDASITPHFKYLAMNLTPLDT